MSVDLGEFRLLLGMVLDEALARGAPPEHVMRVHAVARELCEELAERRDRRRPPTRELVERITQLDRQLQDRDPGERASIVQRRLGLSRSVYYRLRRSSQSQS